MLHELDVESSMLALIDKTKANFPNTSSLEDLAEKICNSYGVKIQHKTLDDQCDGLFDKNRIFLNDGVWYRPRRLFTLFHEICHMLIAFEGEEIIEIITNHAKKDFEAVEEHLCDIGASEFLIPSKEVQGAVDYINIDTYRELLEKYPDSSAPAIAKKLSDLYPQDKKAIFVICCHDETSSPAKECIVEYGFSSRKMLPYRVGRFSRVPNDHLLRMDYHEYTGTIDEGETVFPFKNSKTWGCYGEYFIQNGKLYGILHEKRPVDNSNQMSLI